MKEAILYNCRLVGGLASENVRWADTVNAFKEKETRLVGDVLMITGWLIRQ